MTISQQYFSRLIAWTACTVFVAACSSQDGSSGPLPTQTGGTGGVATAGSSGGGGVGGAGTGGASGASGTNGSGGTGGTSGSAGASVPGGTDGGGGTSAGEMSTPDGGDVLDAAFDGASPDDECVGASLDPGEHTFTLSSANGIAYSYIVVVPEGYEPHTRTPLVVMWHALTSDPEETRALTHVDRTGQDTNAILVYPRSPDKSWDVGTCCTGVVGGTPRDEEIFARELVSAVSSKVCVDPKRIYSSGFSNGAMLSQMLACKMSDVFAAVAPMSGTLTIPEADCQPERPIPILLINGTDDPLVGYSAPSLSGGLSVTDAFAFWGRTNGCTGEPTQTFSNGSATCRAYQGCRDGAEVALCTIQGMGHCVAGMQVESPTNCLTKIAFGILPIALGPPSDDLDGMDTSFEFLMRWTLP